MSEPWYLYQDNHQKGPFTWEELKQLAQAGTIGSGDLLWSEQMEEWTRADRVPELFEEQEKRGRQSHREKKGKEKRGKGKLWWAVSGLLLFLLAGGFMIYHVFFDQDGLFPGDAAHYTVEGVSFAVRYAPAGNFPTGLEDDGEATVEHDYWIGETVVTYELWYRLRTWAEENGYKFSNRGREGSHGDTGEEPSEHGNHPVTTVALHDAVAWCNALSEYLEYQPVYTYQGEPYRDATEEVSRDAIITQKVNGFRLPTPREWELAARYRGSDRSYGAIEHPPGSGKYWTPGNYASGATAPYTDEEATMVAAWYDDNSEVDGSRQSAQPVGQKPADGNDLNLYDMSGNVFSWLDFSEGRPVISRGGSYHWGAEELQIGYENPDRIQEPGSSYRNVGLRVVLSLETGEFITDPVPETEEPEEPEDQEALFSVTSLVEVAWEEDWYDAKVLDFDGNLYYVTYLGYDSSLDEWVDDSRIRERSTESVVTSFEQVRLAVDHDTDAGEADLPETIEVLLADGTAFSNRVEWETTPLDQKEPGKYQLGGELIDFPVNVSNPENFVPEITVQVREENGYTSFLRLGGETVVEDLLFYVEHDEGTHGYYFGKDPDDLTHLVLEDDSGFLAMIVFNEDMYPLQWIMPEMTIAVSLPGDEAFDPAEAIHVFLYDEEEVNYTLDITLDGTVEEVLEAVPAALGEEFLGPVPALKEELRTMEWWSLTVAEVTGLAETPHEIAMASMLSMCHVATSMVEQLEVGEVSQTAARTGRTETVNLFPACEYYRVSTLIGESLLDFARSVGEELSMTFAILSYLERISSGYYDGLDIEGPAVSMLVCRGASSVPNVCHEFYMPNTPDNLSRCVSMCKTSLACFTDICHPMMFSVEDALDLRQP